MRASGTAAADVAADRDAAAATRAAAASSPWECSFAAAASASAAATAAAHHCKARSAGFHPRRRATPQRRPTSGRLPCRPCRLRHRQRTAATAAALGVRLYK
mmetsp:Transcript_11045/g.33146  ORF Transcript_11045/g.33146 Transcript_11045/m.33146 type:complete len:102 (-) Transcript_11045:205-510(-)